VQELPFFEVFLVFLEEVAQKMYQQGRSLRLQELHLSH
jgi:hypothetical protein